MARGGLAGAGSGGAWRGSSAAVSFALHPVGAAVGNVRNDGPELVAAVTGRFTT
jgi:hypothetical protein